MPSLCLGPLGGEQALGLVPVAPREHGRREHVVEDLVPRRPAASAGHAAQDARGVEGAEHRLEPLWLDSRIPGEVVHGVGDLRPGRRHEVVEEPRGKVALVLVETRERALEVLLDDLLGPSELGERRRAQHVRATLALHVPERSSTSWRYGASTRRSRTALVDETPAGEVLLDPAGRDFVEHRLDQLRPRPSTCGPPSSA